MKTYRFTNLITVAFGLAAFSTVGCAREDKVADASLPPAKDPAPAVVPAPIAPVPAVTAAIPDAASAQWSDIKDCTFDSRVQFVAGLKGLEARADGEINELTARRAAMKSTTNTKDWDFAMKEMGDARAYLKSTGDELQKATAENWDQAKDKVGQAWVRTQEAYDKVKNSTTT